MDAMQHERLPHDADFDIIYSSVYFYVWCVFSVTCTGTVSHLNELAIMDTNSLL